MGHQYLLTPEINLCGGGVGGEGGCSPLKSQRALGRELIGSSCLSMQFLILEGQGAFFPDKSTLNKNKLMAIVKYNMVVDNMDSGANPSGFGSLL